MKLKGQLVWTDYLNSQLLHLQPSGLGKVVVYGVLSMIGLCLVGGIILSAVSESFQIGLIIPGFLLAGIVVLSRYALLPWRIKKIFSQQKELSLPFEMEITDNGLIASNELGNSTRPWAHFTKWKENKDMLLLYHSDVMYSIIPKRLFADGEIETIRTHIKKNKIPVARDRYVTGCVVFLLVWLLMAVAFVVFSLRTVSP